MLNEALLRFTLRILHINDVKSFIQLETNTDCQTFRLFMFKSLIKRLLPSTSHSSSNVIKSPSKQAARQYINKNESSQHLVDYSEYFINTLLSPVELYRDQFYDILFGKAKISKQDDELSIYIAMKVETILSKPELILDDLPVLPASLTQIINHLNNDEFDAHLVVDLLKSEPMIAAKVIKLANSPYYNRTNRQVTDIKSAFMQLGAYGLSKGVIDGFMSQLVPQSNLYFQYYGKRIWQHSMATGMIARELIDHSHCKTQSAEGYLIGLICNIGDIVIYQVLVDAFKYSHPDCVPDSWLFRQIITKHSKKLTYAIAKHWGLPESILRVLELQTKLRSSEQLSVIYGKYTVSCYIYEARVISKLKLQLEESTMNRDELKMQACALVHSREALNFINEL